MSIIRVVNFHSSQGSAGQVTQYLNTKSTTICYCHTEDDTKLNEQETVEEDLCYDIIKEDLAKAATF